MRLREPLRAAAVALLLVLAVGCRMDVAVGVDAEADGSGRVRVEVEADAELLRLAGSDTTLVDDLRQAGWEVEGPRSEPGGGATIVATKPFRDPDGARQAFTELGGPFKDLQVERRRTLLRTTTSFRGTVDFRAGIEAFGDQAVADALGTSAAGVDLAEVERTVGGPVDRAVGVTVAARLPGGITRSNAPPGAGDGATWRLRLDDEATLEAESEAWNTTNIAGVVVAGLAALGLIAYGASSLQGRRGDAEA